MVSQFSIKKPESFSFSHTIRSHGWYDLLPFRLSAEKNELAYTFAARGQRGPATAVISEKGDRLSVRLDSAIPDKGVIAASVRHTLRLDEDFAPFYSLLDRNPEMAWIVHARAGRLLRSPTVFEDMVKTLCTTNCSWGLTRNMVTNLVNKLGESSASGGKAFPIPQAMAGVRAEFYRDEIKAGYRSPYLAELAEAVASGRVDPEKWLTTDLPTPDLKAEIKKIKGFGDYAAENLLKLLGRYDGLALDSWLRGQFYKFRNGSKKCSDKKIERHYRPYGEWKGLAIWCDMTEKWFDEIGPANSALNGGQ